MVAVVAFLGVTIATSAPALALAAGCQTTSSFSYAVGGTTIKVPTSMLCHGVTGSGKTITHTRATFGSTSIKTQICNWRIDWVYYNTSGNEYRRSTGATQKSCAWYFQLCRNDGTDRSLAYYGKACAQFYDNGTLRGKQCHSITA